MAGRTEFWGATGSNRASARLQREGNAAIRRHGKSEALTLAHPDRPVDLQNPVVDLHRHTPAPTHEHRIGYRTFQLVAVEAARRHRVLRPEYAVAGSWRRIAGKPHPAGSRDEFRHAVRDGHGAPQQVRSPQQTRTQQGSPPAPKILPAA